jgi:hypothetical protein
MLSFITKGSRYKVHKLALELKLGRPLAEGLQSCHERHCLHRDCCNPQHLYEGTHATNTDDKVSLDRHHKPIGEAHPNSWLNDTKVIAIKRLLAEGKHTQHEIAVLFNVTRHAITKINNGVSWAHVTEPVFSRRGL